ncbi:hypothetical protein NP493_65g07031 [Ridgeia piscesae]|uniref:SPOC domain-containing protein n=1 Tax=Ridgeia piscesae TaxID=27915 RepID=A0AAD9PA85_RIDPI|nr:hypothetical protein NP493_65g07031 [Ridgeia piscesae]
MIPPHMMPGVVAQPQPNLIQTHGLPLDHHPMKGHAAGSGRPPSPLPSPRPITPHVSHVTASLPSPGAQSMMQLQHLHGGTTGREMLMQTEQPHDNMRMLLQRYPVMWQGHLALKNDSSSVQMHFVAGSKSLVTNSLSQFGTDSEGTPLRIAQRMRLEPTQLDGVSRRMQNADEFSMLLALPCGHDHVDIIAHSKTLEIGFISYLQQKQAAGIVNVPVPGSPQPAFVVHIFPPCEFTQMNLHRLAPDLLQNIGSMAHMLIIVTTV